MQHEIFNDMKREPHVTGTADTQFLAGTTHRTRKDQLVDTICGNKRYLLWESYKTQRHKLSAKYRVFNVK